jgi:uncharacterized flavoprotein (TIGR03862 family)
MLCGPFCPQAAMGPSRIELPGLAVIGGGPAGLMAAEVARAAGVEVDLFEAKGSVGRKFLIAGKGGLNLTHSEPRPAFDARYRERAATVGQWLDDFDAAALRDWARGLGVDTFVGTSGRVFPADLKAAPLLRGWVRRLRDAGVRFHVHHRWTGWTGHDTLRFDTPTGDIEAGAKARVFALGGASWPELGSDGAWSAPFAAAGVDVAPLRPANCGFDVRWTPHFIDRFAGAPVKPVVAHWVGVDGRGQARQGELVTSAAGVEGSLVYAASADLRDAIARDGQATLALDLAPGRDEAALRAALARPRKGRSIAEHLRRQAGVQGVKAGLLHEVLGVPLTDDAGRLAAAIKSLPLTLRAPRPIAEAISSAGGVRFEAVDDTLMLRTRPGTFVAGEMLDWEAPTGGYLLTACFASGQRAGEAAVRLLAGGSSRT